MGRDEINEQNKETLQKALSQLPQLEAPSDSWDQIQRQLNDSLKEKLPDYQAPHGSWKKIQDQLERTPITQKRFRPWWVAAGITLLVLSGISLTNDQGILPPAKQVEALGKEVKGLPELKKGEIAVYNDDYAEAEKQMAQCYGKMSPQKISEVRAEVSSYYQLAARHDSLTTEALKEEPHLYTEWMAMDSMRRAFLKKFLSIYCE